MIHICYGLYDKVGRYSKFTGTSMFSIFANTKAAVTVHILHDNTLTETNRERFETVADRYSQRVEFHNVEKICADKIQFLREKLAVYLDTRFSIGAFYRLLIKYIDLEDVAKIIYLDADTIVHTDIQELWDYPMGDYEIAATPEEQATLGYMIKDKYLLHSGKVRAENYFCSGVVVMALDKIGADFFERGVNWLADNLQCECPDQDILNNFYSTNYVKLPNKFDTFVEVPKNLGHTKVEPAIYHYVASSLGMNMKNVWDRLFFAYFTKTPWFCLETLEHIYEGIDQIYTEQRILTLQISAIVSKRQRAFFVPSSFLDAAKKFFFIDPKEEIIAADSLEAIPKLAKAMGKSRGKKFFFVVVNEYRLVREQLMAAGFLDGTDFFDATQLLPRIGQISTHALVKAL